MMTQRAKSAQRCLSFPSTGTTLIFLLAHASTNSRIVVNAAFCISKPATNNQIMLPRSLCTRKLLSRQSASNDNIHTGSDHQHQQHRPYPTTSPQFSKNSNSINDRDTGRREVLSAIFGGVASSCLLLPALPSHAGEVGARITKAVTTSDLGVSVRTSVVRGAQVMDQLDGKWEGFSDKFGLGSERSKQVGRPAPKVIPDPLPLDASTAAAILKLADDVYLSLVPAVKTAQLDAQITKVSGLVRPSFQRSGTSIVELDDNNNNVRDVKTAAQFNFASYVHFKAYSDLILQLGKSFDYNGFRRSFEAQFGQRLVALLLPQVAIKGVGATKARTEQVLTSKLKQIDQLCDVLKEKGLLSLTERSPLEKDQVSDWIDDVSELTFTVALDGDITLKTQMLLQEMGFRLYPDYARFGVLALLRDIEGQQVQIEDYYFDTDYNSDPDKFEVKEVVLNIVLDSV